MSPTLWQSRAKETAAAAIRRLPGDSTFAEKLLVGSAAVRQITSDFEDDELRKRILRAAYLWDVAPEEREHAQAALQKELGSLPIGTSALAMEKAREQALFPFRESKKRKCARQSCSRTHPKPMSESCISQTETDFESDWAISEFRSRDWNTEISARCSNRNYSMTTSVMTSSASCLKKWVDEALDWLEENAGERRNRVEELLTAFQRLPQL